jgi:hypothetical protein
MDAGGRITSGTVIETTVLRMKLFQNKGDGGIKF